MTAVSDARDGQAAEITQPDLASRWLGGSVIAASDESFGEKENLLTPAAAAFEPGRYSHRGEIVDGWETKRRREPGHDWALIRLGAPGIVTSVEVDTSFFTGNHPESCLVEACGREGYPSPAELADPAGWTMIVPRSPLAADTRNRSKSPILAGTPTCACRSSRTAAWPGCGRTATSCRTPASWTG